MTDTQETVHTTTIIRVGTWQRAVTRQGTDLARDVAPVIDGTTTIGHLWRFADRHYLAVLGSLGPGGYHLARNPQAPPITRDGLYRPAEYTQAHRFTFGFAAMMAVALHHHQI